MSKFGKLGNDLYSGKVSIDFIGKRRTWFMITGALMVFSVLILGIRGINPGIDFRGGSEFKISGAADTSEGPARQVLSAQGISDQAKVARIGTSSVRVQTETVDNTKTAAIRQELAKAYKVGEDSVTSAFVGPAWGKDVSSKALKGLVIFLVLVSLAMTAYFRNWKMAVGGLAALFHDLVLTVGVYALLGFEVTPSSVIGFLTILGYSLYDTVVVFDKVRENTAGLEKQSGFTYQEAANLAVNQTVVRSLHTSISSLLPVGSILIFGTIILGAGSLSDIAIALFVGMALSTISSIFIAAPVEAELSLRSRAVVAHTERVMSRRGGSRAAKPAGAESSAKAKRPKEPAVVGGAEQSGADTAAQRDKKTANKAASNDVATHRPGPKRRIPRSKRKRGR